MADSPRKQSARATTRASGRQPLEIDCSTQELRNLMTEQCRIPTGFATFYEGSSDELISAGFPAGVLPTGEGRRMKLRISPGGACYQSVADAWITAKGSKFELEIHWNSSGPGRCGHPALVEMGRIALNALSYWTSPRDYQSNEAPVDRLLASKAASDYRMPAHKRFQYTPEFHRQLLELHQAVYRTMQLGEIFPVGAHPAAAEPVEPEVTETDINAERITRDLIRNAKRT